VIFYCEELDEIIIFTGLDLNGEANRYNFISSPWFKGYCDIEQHHNLVLIGYL
jgi:hypothetical protein